MDASLADPTALRAALRARGEPAAVSGHPVIACYRGLDSANAVQLGAELARALEEPLVLCSAYGYEPIGLSARVVAPTDNARRSAAAHAAVRRARAFAGDAVEIRAHVVPATNIAVALTEFATAQNACAIVVGRDVEGHVVRSLLPSAPCPVVVAQSSVAEPRPDIPARIGIAYDGTPGAQTALATAQQLASATGAQLDVLTVADDDTANGWLREAQRHTRCRAGLDAHAMRGDPATALIAASEDLDLLVCGSRGRGRVRSKLLGSVSTRLVEGAHCAVVVVPL